MNDPVNFIQIYTSLKCLVDFASPYISSILLPVCLTTGLAFGSMTLYFTCGSRGPIEERILFGIFFLGVAMFESAAIHFPASVSTFTQELLQTWKLYFSKETPRRKWDGSKTNMMAYYRHMRMRSLTPLRIQVGNTYYLDKFSILDFWLNVVDKTFLLLSCFPLH